MSAPFYYRGAGDEGDLRLLLQFSDGDSTTATHRRLHLPKGLGKVILELTSIRDVAVYTFFELHAFGATAVIALPVLSTIGAFAPVFLDDVVADLQLAGR